MTYPEAMIPSLRRVGPFLLQPLTLGHELLLQRIASPLAMEAPAKAALSSGAVAAAFLICTLPWRRAMRAMGGFAFGLSIWWHGSRIARDPSFWAAEFAAHRNAQWAGPDFKDLSESGGERHGAPLLASLKMAAQAVLHLSEDDALDRPIALTLWELAIVSERAGKCLIKAGACPTEDEEFFAYARKVTAENRARLEGAPRG